VIADRMQRDLVGTGVALMAGLIKAAKDRGIPMRCNVRARRLLIEDGVVIGLEAEENGRTIRICARRGVVIASGGFEWNPDLVKNFIYGPELAPISPPFNEGDGLKMAMDVGAELSNMSEAVYHASMRIPNEEYDGRQLNRLTSAERHNPGSILVNAAGRRFVNEGLCYHDVCLAMRVLDPVAFTYQNQPSWIIVHHAFLEKYPILTRYPGDPIPRWLTQAPTLRELAAKIGVNPEGLEATVTRFNQNARNGVDPDFHRGESAYDRYYGDRTKEGAYQTLGALDQAPFYAIEMRVGAIGTRGGPTVDDKAQVLSIQGGIIPGLYAAGNAMAAITGMSYPGAGATIGPALTFGYIAGKSAAVRTNRF
jgi:3-oxosteroid 1-dehydrogenase